MVGFFLLRILCTQVSEYFHSKDILDVEYGQTYTGDILSGPPRPVCKDSRVSMLKFIYVRMSICRCLLG